MKTVEVHLIIWTTFNSRHPISGAKDSPGKLHGKSHKVMDCHDLRQYCKLHLFQFNNWY